MNLRRCLYFILCFLSIISCSSGNIDEIGKMKDAAFNNSNYYYPDIHFGMSQAELIRTLGQPTDKYSVEGIGYYRYDKTAFGFNGYVDYIEPDGLIIAFDYFINASYKDIEKIFGTERELYSFLDYGTFIMEYKNEKIILDFWPANNAKVDKQLIGMDKRENETKFMQIMNDNIRSFRFNVLTINKNE